jgi:hypothetical protein
MKSLPPDDVPPELEKEAWAEFQKTLDEYIAGYSQAIARIVGRRQGSPD